MNRYNVTLTIALVSLTIISLAQSQFQNAKTIAAAKGYSITPLLGDYDGDGDLDILGTGYYSKDGGRSDATVLFRNDGGNFIVVDIQLPWFYSGGMYQWADLDNDNDLDIIAGGCSSYCYNSKMMSIYRNDGGDKFTLITSATNLIGGKLFSLADYNNDGLIDIEIATQSDNDDSVIGHLFYKNQGNFTFQKTFQLSVVTGEMAWCDLNNDGWKDFVLYNSAYKNLRNGTFEAFSPTPQMQNDFSHFIFDADNDGDQDIITGNGILMENDGTGQLTYGPIIIPYGVSSLQVADFDGDGDKDMAVSGGTDWGGSKTQLFRSDGGLNFTAEDLNERYSQFYKLAVGDIDNDKDPDIILSSVFLDEIVILDNGLSTVLSKPVAPSNLHMTSNAGTITYSWNAAIDNEQTSLAYNFYLMHGSNFKIVPNADHVTGASFIPGYANSTSALQKTIAVSDLAEGYYRWSVQAVDAELNASVFAPAQEFTLYKNNPANAPANLAYTVTDRSVSLTWEDHASNEVGYTVERSTVDGNTGFVAIKQMPANTTSYTDNTALPRSVYYYRIRLDGSTVAYSNVTRVETQSTIGTAPANVTAIALNSASAKIDWTYSGTGITGFVIERSLIDKKHFEIAGTVGAAQHTYSDQQLESGNTYYYRVYAVTGQDVSDYSTTATVTFPLKELNKIVLPSLAYEPTYISGGIAWGDYDSDGYDDLFLGYRAQLFHNERNGTFRRIEETGIPVNSTSDAVSVWGDYDNDGFLDLFYYNEQEKSSIYRGHGDGSFTKIVTAVNSDRSNISSASWTDIDMDGDLDLSITGGSNVYRNDGADIFTRVDFPRPNAYGSYNASVASWADFDDDGDPDVFLGNNGKDEFFRNNGDGSFTAITDQRVTVDYNYDCCPISTPTALWTDFNNDRKLDLTILHAGAPIYAYANHTNKLDSVFSFYDYYWENWKNMFWTDYDSDGDLDLFAMGQYNARTNIWETKGNQPFRRLKGGPLYDYVPSDANFSWNDFDNDGFSDLFKFDSNHEVFKNPSNGNNWIKIRLRGRQSNSTGLSAKILVKANGRWQRTDVTTHHSYRVQQGFMSLFGVGRATQIDSIIVKWPSGNLQYTTHVNVNQILLIDENGAQEKVVQAPSNLTAKVTYPSSVQLEWTDRSNDETGFVIEMMIGEGEYKVAGTTGSNVTSFKISGLSMGVKYKFRVHASPSPNTRYTNPVDVQIRLFTEAFAGDLTTYQSRPEGMAWGDPDNDGDPDLFVGSESFEPEAVYYNDHGLFTRKLLRSNTSYSRQAQWIDYNNDGFQDLHVSVGGSIGASAEALNDILYKNDGTGSLVEQPDHTLAKDGKPDFAAAWGDLNKDGYLDVITSSRRDRNVFYNLGGNFAPQESALTFQNEGLILFSDLDDDRDLDLITTSQYDYFAIYKNDKNAFSRLNDGSIYGSLFNFILEDFDNDGFQDLLMSDYGQKLRLFLLDPISKKFKEKLNVFPSSVGVWRMSAGDFDNNGYIDVFYTTEFGYSNNRSKIYLNNGNLQFTSLEDPALDRNMSGTALADVNKDGHLDVISLARDNNYNTNRFLLQGSPTENNWLRIKLKGVENNLFGIGAKIRLFTGIEAQVREIRSGSGGTFSDEQIAHFGLGKSTSVDYVKVEWPSGEDQWIANPAINTEVVVEQANTPAPPGPGKPTDLSAAIRGPRYIDLQWSDNSNDESQFLIERAMATGPFEPFKLVPANTTSYTDSIFANNPQFNSDVKYRVIAIKFTTVKSEPSNEAALSLITGVEGQEESLAIYPQPASSKVFVRGPRPIRHVSIIGARGEMISDVSFDGSSEVEVKLGGIAPGMYIIAITDDKEVTMRKLLVAGSN